MSSVAVLNDGATGWPGRATADAGYVPSTSDRPEHHVKIRPEDFPHCDAEIVRMVLSGEYPLRERLRDRVFSPDGQSSEDRKTPCPVGASSCPEECTSINVWGLSEDVTVNELQTLCSSFGAVADVNLQKPKAGGDQARATVRFTDRLAAQQAQASLHRTDLHGKELRVGWDSDGDEWGTTCNHWLYVWIDKGLTGKQLYDGFRQGGAPCTDARVVRGPCAGDSEGIGALAFRTANDRLAVRKALPKSAKTDWSRSRTSFPERQLTLVGVEAWQQYYGACYGKLGINI